MRLYASFLILSLVFTAGCVDSRMKRQASYVNTVTVVAEKEFKAAATDKEKAGVAAKYFERMPKHTQLLEDYLHGREPSTPSPEELEKKAKAEKLGVVKPGE